MRCLAVCHTELIARILDTVLQSSFDLEILVESRQLARKLHDAGMAASGADLNRTDTYLKAELSPGTCVIVEDTGRGGLRRILQAITDTGGSLVYVLSAGPRPDGRREADLRARFPDVQHLSLAELIGSPLLTEVSRSLTRARVQQYQRYFSDADRVLIVLHNDPDPDAMASGLALRNLLRRTKTTAILAALQGVTRPENLRMANLLDIQVETLTPQMLSEFERVAMVDVQPHYFAGLMDRVDLVIDHHPQQQGYSAVFKDIRPHYGSTSTILTEHLRAVDVNISERTATAMLYAIKSDTLFFNRQANRVDLEAFSFLYPLADAALIRKMEGSEITLERLDYVMRAFQHGRMTEQVFCAFIGPVPREDLVPYVADFYLQLENVRWTIIAGLVGDLLTISVRNIGYARNAGELVRKHFADIGSAGGHRSMAKAVVPVQAFREKFGSDDTDAIGAKVQELALAFLHEHQPSEKKKETIRA